MAKQIAQTNGQIRIDKLPMREVNQSSFICVVQDNEGNTFASMRQITPEKLERFKKASERGTIK